MKWDKYLQSEYQKIPQSPDSPDLAALQNYYMTIDPELMRVPSERLYQSWIETKEILLQKEYKNSSNNLDWTEVGSNMGGRTRAFMFDPNDPDKTKVWAGSVTGGLWFNNNIYDDESQWQAVNDFWPSLSISCLIADPIDPMTFYAGTGEPQTARVIYRESSGVGIGIWKSTDGGESWEIIPSTESIKYISDLKIRVEAGTSVLYAGVVSGFYQGVNHQSEPDEGLYRSTDGGESWEQVLPNIIGEEMAYVPADIEIGPEGRIFIGTMKNMDGKGGATVLYSDQGTPGSWTIFDEYEEIILNSLDLNIPDRVILASAPSDANRVYALIGAGWINTSNFNYAKGRYILRSENGGESWTETNLPDNTSDWATISWHALIAAVNPQNPNEFYAGGKDVYKTTDAGFSWTRVSDWTLMYSGGGENYVHCDQHVQHYINNSVDSIILCSDGGVFFTNNASSADPVFQEKNNHFSTLQFYTCDIYPEQDQNYFVGGLQDNGTLLSLGEPFSVGDMIDEGDGAYCFFDDDEPNIMITSTYFNKYSLFNNWNYVQEMGEDGSGVFISPADYDSKNNILFANAVKFNNGYSDQIMRVSGIPDNPITQMKYLATGNSTYFSHVKVSPYAPVGTSTLFLGTQNGRLFKVFDAQNIPVVSEIGSENFPTAYLTSVAIGGSEDTLLVTFSNYGVPSVWQSYDGGNNWDDISGNLPDMPVRWSLYHPDKSIKVMLATELGIWTTSDASSESVVWEPEAELPNVRVDMIQLRENDKTVLAASHGRGLFYTSWEYNPISKVTLPEKRMVNVFPNPASHQISIYLSSNIDRISIYNTSGQLVKEELPGTQKTIINMADLITGVYILMIESGNEEIYNKLIIE
jgi:photosystem II stability/assembly factor-like uncharacterized protein